jgi:4-hydroxy-3-polyprenylbenzoate decarboxylase
MMRRLVVGISGASGAILGVRLMEVLSSMPVEVHLVVSDAARKTIEIETTWKVEDVLALADRAYHPADIGTPIESGSFKTDGMVVIPCTMKTLSGIAYSFANSLMIRAADVALKERRTLVLVPREMPLHQGHLEMLLRASRLGSIILPPLLTFYQSPETIGDMVDYVVGKVLDCFALEHCLFKRWEGA